MLIAAAVHQLLCVCYPHMIASLADTQAISRPDEDLFRLMPPLKDAPWSLCRSVAARLYSMNQLSDMNTRGIEQYLRVSMTQLAGSHPLGWAKHLRGTARCLWLG